MSGTTLNLNAANGSETIGSLFLDGNAVLPGTYTAAQLTGFDPGINFASAFGETLTITAVPEPATWGAGVGCLGLAAASLRRRRVLSWLRCSRVS